MGFAKPNSSKYWGYFSKTKYQQRLLYDNLDFGHLFSDIQRRNYKELEKNLESLKSTNGKIFKKNFYELQIHFLLRR